MSVAAMKAKKSIANSAGVVTESVPTGWMKQYQAMKPVATATADPAAAPAKKAVRDDGREEGEKGKAGRQHLVDREAQEGRDRDGREHEDALEQGRAAGRPAQDEPAQPVRQFRSEQSQPSTLR